MRLQKSKIQGCYEIFPSIVKDARGCFVKTYHNDFYSGNGLTTVFAEEYYSYSVNNVLRGMHFQTPPFEQTKIVHCVSGTVMDAIIDLRIGSPTYGKFETFTVSAEKANMLYIPPGIAHGFYVTSDFAILMYKVTSVYSPEHDSGIRWDTTGISWPSSQPILSTRDSEFVSLHDFTSPFLFKKESSL